jgi:hypothetical protein
VGQVEQVSAVLDGNKLGHGSVLGKWFDTFNIPPLYRTVNPALGFFLSAIGFCSGFC